MRSTHVATDRAVDALQIYMQPSHQHHRGHASIIGLIRHAANTRLGGLTPRHGQAPRPAARHTLGSWPIQLSAGVHTPEPAADGVWTAVG